MADNSITFLCNPEIYLLLFRFFIYLFFTQIILLSVLVSDYGYRNKRKEEKKCSLKSFYHCFRVVVKSLY